MIEFIDILFRDIFGFNIKSFEDAECAIIDPEKLNAYVLNFSQKRILFSEDQSIQDLNEHDVTIEGQQKSTDELKKNPFRLFLPYSNSSKKRSFYCTHYIVFFVALMSEFYERLKFVIFMDLIDSLKSY